jgi:dephospho-CoA kinase
MKTIGLTGNICSGKSTVSRYLGSIGAKIIDADAVAREVVLPGTPALEEIIKHFGLGIIDETGNLHRKKLGELVFADPMAMNVLNSITHPRIVKSIENTKSMLQESEVSLLVIDAPLLIEVCLHKGLDEIWVVAISLSKQIERLILRDGISEKEALKRVEAQMPQRDKLKYAHRVIDNNGSPQDTIEQVKGYLAELKI